MDTKFNNEIREVEDIVNFLKNRTKKSAEMYKRACESIPSGVTSRGKIYPPYPFIIKKASGSKIWDIDGNEYIDCAMSYGIAILGHCPSIVVKAIQKKAEVGLNYTIIHEGEIRLAELIKKAVPSIDRVTFCVSGTGATMHAIRMARTLTGKTLIAKFEGGYHGDHDYSLVSAYEHPDNQLGPVDKPNRVADSLGIPKEVQSTVLVLPFNHSEAFDIIRKNKNHLAVVMVEGLQGAGGCISADKDFLIELRKITKELGIPLLMDEVFTGFRLALGGAQEFFDIQADIVVYGKIIGGGLPGAAIGGRKEIMDIITYSGNREKDNLSKCHYAGTCNGNVLVMEAGAATIKYLIDHPEVYEYINKQGNHIRNEINTFCKSEDIPAQANGEGSIFYTHFVTGSIKRARDLNKVNKKAQHAFFLSLLKHNLFIPYMHLGMISAAHTEEDIQFVIDVHKKALLDVKNLNLL